ncbi:MAG: GNAT family N-acetyltransferase [Oscillospiraceae bacterium]|nr:GNAT family N-acetyltransferase [Oscillospiraceae bacterium]
MDNCILIKPGTFHAREIAAYRGEMLAAGSPMDGTGILKHTEDVLEWLAYCLLCENEETVPQGLVAADQFVFVRKADEKIVGMIQLRRRLNNQLREFGGHIGYSVRPSERRRGYAKRMLKDCLAVCRAKGISPVLLTCRVQNEASRRTILANGGVYENTVFCEAEGESLERYWITL